MNDEHTTDTADDAETGAPPAPAGSDLDAMISAALNADAIKETAHDAATEMLKKAVEKATRQATAEIFSDEQLGHIREHTAAAVQQIFPRPESEDDDADEEQAPLLDEEYTALFLSWAAEFLPIIETANQSTEEHLWCTLWYLHPEAIARLTALWLAWEEARGSDDQRARSSWWVDHWDRHVPMLLSSRGPFRKCELEHRAPVVRLGYQAPPETFLIPRH
ncbi:DUF4913 domain-containing protein [Leifsonia sp. McL0607]|uniref:DUF4913 domain-containing protein n=1 Tax=Leifsonia sp. McL0607 TaxID=3415672 RepID=UPI003CF90339